MGEIFSRKVELGKKMDIRTTNNSDFDRQIFGESWDFGLSRLINTGRWQAQCTLERQLKVQDWWLENILETNQNRSR